MENSIPASQKPSWLDHSLIPALPKIKLEHFLVTLIILLTVVSRFYIVGARVMSHDEVNHVVPSYDLYLGKGYSHDPVTHGPLQFHLLAASYFLFGDSDFSSRVPAALFSIATVVFVLFAFRRYLGRTGALLAGLFFMISPYMLFYGRYTRNESFIGLFTVVLLYAVLCYLEKGGKGTLFLYTAVLGLYFCTKETSFIFTAEMLIFLALVFLKDVTQKEWKNPVKRDLFILLVMVALLFVGIALGTGVIDAKTNPASAVAAESAVAPADPTTTDIPSTPSLIRIIMLTSVGLAGASLVAALVFLITGLGWSYIKDIRSFDLLILSLTLVMPQLIAFPISLLGWNPLDYSQPGLIKTSIVLLVVLAITVAIGMFWKPSLWLKNTALFYAIFTLFYTTFFTNGQGFFTGMVGSLGYWLSQQSVNRGTQPLYYYALLQLPMYEYLAVLGTLTAVIVAFIHKLFTIMPGVELVEQARTNRAHEQAKQEQKLAALTTEAEQTGESQEISQALPINTEYEPKKLPVLLLLVYWSIMSLLAYSVAGEKMPWLTVHITLPMLLAAGFGVGYLVDSLFAQKWSRKSLLSLLLFPIFLICLGSVLGSFFGPEKPFAGMELAQLQITSTFLLSSITVVLSGWGIVKLMEGWQNQSLFKTLVTACFTILAVLTARSAFQASFINYDNGKEFLVYAHAARGPKDVLEQVADISQRTTGGKEIKVAYIGDALYPYWWYFRDYPNKYWVKDKLTHDLEQYAAVISDDTYLEKTRAILDNDYYEFKYKRLVWPMQDYMGQTIKSAWQAFRDPQMRQALFDIWFDKDYTLYSQLKSLTTLTVENWQPSGNIYLFLKKDIVTSIWTYGTVPVVADNTVSDPYVEKMTSLIPDLFFGEPGKLEGQFENAHDIAIGKNGNIYITDAYNHRIQQFSADGQFIKSWGTYANIAEGDAPAGTFNEPWGIAVGPDGSVYITDTWNYRVQKFSADGQFITMWGKSGTADQPDSFWGPRGIAVNSSGQVFITDTGNNRVVIFDENGRYLSQFGINGINYGEFDEPVGLAFDSQDNLYVADAWNRRVQVFAPNEDLLTYQYLREWAVSAWDGQSINNKPFIAVDSNGNVFVTDPDGYRVLEFDSTGNFIRGWGDYSSGIDGFGMPIGIAVDAEDRVWVSDAENGYMLRYTLPIEEKVSLLPEGLPELPLSNNPLTYNFSTGLLEDPFEQAVYRLSPSGDTWFPIIPDWVLTQIPQNSLPEKSEDGNWVLLLEDGTVGFTWQPDVLLWIPSTIEEISPTSS